MTIANTTTELSQMTLLESMVQNMPLWFQQGGIVMWLLLLVSFLTTMVTLERLFIWSFYYRQKESFALQACFSALNKRDKTEALLACQKADTPALKMLECGIKILDFSPKEKIKLYNESQINLLSRGQSLLRSVIILSPILGLLGSVLTLIGTFNVLSLQSIEVSTAAILGSISQSLTPTATGLSVALLAIIPYHLFRSLINKLAVHLENISCEFNHICQQRKLITNELSEIAQKQENAENEAAKEKVPYHYEISEETGKVNMTINKQNESIQRTAPLSIAEMYNDELPSLYKHIKPEPTETVNQAPEQSNDAPTEK